MMTLKQLLESSESASPDGKHWEPAIPLAGPGLRWRDAIAVLRGRAIAVRQTTKRDLETQP